MIVDTRAEVAERYRRGETMADLADDYGLSVATVRRWLTAAGLREPGRPAPPVRDVVPRPRVTPRQHREIVRRLKLGETPTALARAVGVHRSTVYRHAP